jgi:hypothetical protein
MSSLVVTCRKQSASMVFAASQQAMTLSTKSPKYLMHAYMGYLICTFLLIQVLQGALAHYIANRSKAPPRWFVQLRRLHKGVGWLCIVFGWVNCYLGARGFIPEYSAVMIVVPLAWAAAFAWLSCRTVIACIISAVGRTLLLFLLLLILMYIAVSIGVSMIAVTAPVALLCR